MKYFENILKLKYEVKCNTVTGDRCGQVSSGKMYKLDYKQVVQ